MPAAKLVSIIINNYNYGSYLGVSIDSALAQTYPKLEVIVVDDGSTDNSQEVLKKYSGRVNIVLKENEGQITACTTGLSKSTGEIVCFLDADDFLFPTAVEKAVPFFDDANVVKVHWPLLEVDENGASTGNIVPAKPLHEGDLRNETILKGPLIYTTSPTSGNAWSRNFLELISPIQELGNKHGADAYLSILAPIYGHIKTVALPQGAYRIHQSNFSARRKGRKRHPDLFDIHAHLLERYLERIGIEADTASWKHQLYEWEYSFINEIEKFIPLESKIILLDDNQLHHALLKFRKVFPFPENNGEFAGYPASDETAIDELEKLRISGAEFIVFTSAAFWWFDHYKSFCGYIENNCSLITSNKKLVIYRFQ